MASLDCSSKALRAKIVIPTYNGGAVWKACAQAVARAREKSARIAEVLVVDSSSHDDTVAAAQARGFSVQRIDARDFDHGRTRNHACFSTENADIVIFLTQDAILHTDTALETLIDAFADPAVAVAYGRQLPHVDGNPIATHARLFNYRDSSYVANYGSKTTMGIKSVFTSNSFAAYRLSVFRELGGFPDKSILSEDMYFAARAVLAGHKIAYVADAPVRHSHNYRPLEEFRRYFDIGVFHHDQDWIATAFGGAGGEGRRFIVSELKYLLENAPLWVPRACLHNFFKLLGYKLGKSHDTLPLSLKRQFSMHKSYWNG